ncbi:MAG: hypothetical protein EAZ55_14490 [Cytophagales bacterium]|nr:MAG: hypothetical protein EAZ55_14490 [Cytophagales bacterium]
MKVSKTLKFLSKMKSQELNKQLLQIIDKRIALNQLSYNDSQYDILEEELHRLEDGLMKIYGKELERIIQTVHRLYCPESEALSPISYLAKEYEIVDNEGEKDYEIVDHHQGLPVKSRKHGEAFLVMLPNPPRMLMIARGGTHVEEVWSADDLLEGAVVW